MNIKQVYLVAALDNLTFGLMVSAITPHLLSLGCSHFAVGFMNSTIALVKLICNPIIGSLSDTKGRKSTLLKTLALGIFCNFCIGLLYTTYAGVFIYRILYAFSNQTTLLLKALIADNVASDKQSIVFGNLGAFMALGFITAPVISGTILESQGGFHNLSLLMTVLTAISLGTALLLPDSTPVEHTKKEKEERVHLSLTRTVYKELAKIVNNFKLINWDKYWDLFLLKFIIEISFNCFYASFGIVLLTEFSFTHKQMGYTMALHAFSFVVFNPLYATVKTKFYSGDKTGVTRIRNSCFLLVATLLGFITAPTWWIYVLFMVPISVVRILADSTCTEILVLRTEATEKGTVMGAFESVMSLSSLITPLMLGLITDTWGSYAPFITALIPSTASIYIVNKMQNISNKYTQ